MRRSLQQAERRPITRLDLVGAAVFALLLAVVTAFPNEARAQSENLIAPGQSTKTPSSFGNSTKSGPFGGMKARKIDKASPLLLEGDELIYDTRNNRVIARGNVEIYYNEYILTADQVIYDQAANTLTAEGNAQIKEPDGNIVRADKLVTTDDFRDAFVQSLSVVGKDDSRIAARRAVRKDGNVSEFEQGKFTPCKNDPGKPPLWCISAQRIIHDQQAASISYQDAQFELLGVPIFYMPYFTHADPSVKRRTGFLIPEIGYNSALGYMTEVPYYMALSAHYDFLFHPLYMSEQGVLWKGDWRQKVALGSIRGEYSIKIAGIEQDGSKLPADVSAARRAQLDGWRGTVETKGQFSLASWWKFGWDITLESDDTFRRFYKFDSVLLTDRVNRIFMEGISDRNYLGINFYQFGGLLLEDTAASESRVHPVIDYRYIVGQPVLGGELSFSANALSLSRSDGTDSNRLSVQADWRRKLVDGIGQVWTPFARARADAGQFTNGYDPNTGVSIPEDTFTRGIAAAGLTYAYPFVAHTANASHVVEPIGQIIARPNHLSQVRMPDEDARSLVWDDTLIFDVDKFSGWDRTDSGTRANVGLQYTFQSNSGPYARLIAGQSFHLAGENPYATPGLAPNGLNGTLVANFSPSSGLDTSKSDYVLGAYLVPNNNWRVVAQGRFDDTELSLRRANVYSSLSFGPLALAGQYSYTRDDALLQLYQSEQELLGSATVRLTDRWSIIGSARYDLDSNFLLQQIAALKYADECFVLTATYTENHIDNPSLDLKPDRSLMLRFELKYLGDFKYKNDQLNNIFGTEQTQN
ncbi:MAG: LPS-assembly protein LptD [Hyphomicrobiaceae bacterium]